MARYEFIDDEEYEFSAIPCTNCREAHLDDECVCPKCGFDAVDDWHQRNLVRIAERAEY